MRRSQFLIMCALVVALAGGAAAGLALALRGEPTFYAAADVPAGPTRKQKSGEFQSRFVRFLESVVINRDQSWGESFTAEQLNSYLREDFLQHGEYDRLLPEGFHDPRVSLEPGRVRLAARYGEGEVSTVVSLSLKVWLVPGKTNTVGVELEDFRAGHLPLTTQSLLEHVWEQCRQLNIDCNWYRHERNHVAVLRFEADQHTPSFQVTRLCPGEGRFEVTGKSFESRPGAAGR